MVGCGNPAPIDRAAAVRARAEAQQDRLDDRRVVVDHVADATLHVRRDDERRHAHAVAAHGRPVVRGRERSRIDVVVEAAVLVVGDDEKRLLPRRGTHHGREEAEHQLLPGHRRRRRMVVVRPGRAEQAEVHEVRVDPGDRRQLSLPRIVQERLPLEQRLAVEVRELVVVLEPVAPVDAPQRARVVRVPAPGDVVGVELAHERLEVVDRRPAVGRRPVGLAGDGVETVRPRRPGDGAEPPVADLERAGEIVVDRDVVGAEVREDERRIELEAVRRRIVLRVALERLDVVLDEAGHPTRDLLP